MKLIGLVTGALVLVAAALAGWGGAFPQAAEGPSAEVRTGDWWRRVVVPFQTSKVTLPPVGISSSMPTWALNVVQPAGTV